MPLWPPSLEAVGGVVLLSAVLGVALGDATGWLRCEQHYAGNGVEMRRVEAVAARLTAERGRLPSAAELAAAWPDGTMPTDFWGRPFEVVALEQGPWPLALRSLGRDGRPGGIGEDADFTSREFDAGPYTLPLSAELRALRRD